MKRIIWSLALICPALAGIASPLQAQMLNHDVSAGPQFSAGRVSAVTPLMAHCVALESERVSRALAARTLVGRLSNRPIPAPAQAAVWSVIRGETRSSELADALSAGGGAPAASALAESMRGLTTSPRSGQVTAAIGHFNRFVAGSDEAFLAAPPAEFEAVHTVLLAISCLPPQPVRVVERLITVCVMTTDGVLLDVEAALAPATGDTLVAGRPFREVYPIDLGLYAAGHGWVTPDRPMDFRGREFVMWGSSRILSPDWLQRVGEFRGVPIFAEADASEPFGLLYVPLSPRCEFQPYHPRPREDITG